MGRTWFSVIAMLAVSVLCTSVLPGAASAVSRQAASGNTATGQHAITSQHAAAAAGNWGKAIPVPGLEKMNTGHDALTTAIACASPGNCSAGGSYATADRTDEPWVDTEKNGTWKSALEVPGIGALNTGEPISTEQVNPGITSIACPAAGDCAAVGVYYTGSSPQLFVVNEKGGVWGKAEPMPGMLALKKNGPADPYQVSCGAVGDCSVAGFFGGDLEQRAFVDSERGGTWQKAKVVPGIAAIDGGSYSTLMSVSCASAGNCTAGGGDGGTVGAFAVSEVNGTWHDAVAIKPPAAEPGRLGNIVSVSCWAAGACVGVANASADFGTTPYVITQSGGAWSVPKAVTGGVLNDSFQVNLVSCASGGNCALEGLTDNATSTATIVWTAGVTGGSPGVPVKGPGMSVAAMSCSRSGQCGLGGFGPSGALVASGSAGSFGAATVLPGSASLGRDGAEVDAVSCAAGGCGAGGYYTAAISDTQALVTGGGGTAPCQQVTQPDGRYEFGACVTKKDGGQVDVTDTGSNVDGIDVSASASDDVTYDDGSAVGHEVTSSGTSTLSLKVGGAQTTLFKGKVRAKLTGRLSYKLPKGSSIAGWPVSGTLTVNAGVKNGKATGKASEQIGTTLPAVLGGGKVTLTASSAVNRNVTGVTVKVAKASFLGMFKLSNLVLQYKSSAGGQTWGVEADASTGGKTATKLKGSLTYSGGKLTAATLTTGKISLAGLLDLTKLDVSYKNGAWHGDAAVVNGKTTSKASIDMSVSGTTLTKAVIKASNVSLFGVLEAKTFVLSYAAGAWAIAVAAADGGSVSGSLAAAGGVITAGRLTVTHVSFLGKFTVAQADVSYAQQANAACPRVPGSEIWCGSWQVKLPAATGVTGIGGTLAVADGAFASGSVTLTGSVPLPLPDGLFLTSLGGGVTVTPPVTISGKVGLRFGPVVKGVSILAVTGELTRQLPGGGTSGAYLFDGKLTALGVLSGDAHVTIPGDGAATKVSLDATAVVGKAKATGTLTGTFTADTFTLSGNVQIKVLGLSVKGSLKANNTGIAACGESNGKEAGFEYKWNGSLTWYGKAGCTEHGF